MSQDDDQTPPEPTALELAGKPENRGEPPPETRFAKGQSGNPGGRPKDLPKFRNACRKLTWEALDVIEAGLSDPDVSFGDKVTAFKALADRGGFLPIDRQAAIESNQARLVLAMLMAEELTPPERKKLLEVMERSLAGGAGAD